MLNASSANCGPQILTEVSVKKSFEIRKFLSDVSKEDHRIVDKDGWLTAGAVLGNTFD